jgi:hypothetical protein
MGKGGGTAPRICPAYPRCTPSCCVCINRGSTLCGTPAVSVDLWRPALLLGVVTVGGLLATRSLVDIVYSVGSHFVLLYQRNLHIDSVYLFFSFSEREREREHHIESP